MNLQFSSCTYGYRRRRPPVIEKLDYTISEGLTVLLGPNGAGKSTLLKIAASVITPRSGSVTFGDLRFASASYRQAVAWMPQTITPLPSLTAREYVAYVGWLKGLGRSDAWHRAHRALERVELTDKASEKTSRLSGGQLRRVGLAAALVHEARVILLDEPTAGMDPRQRRVFRDILAGVAGDASVLLSTHDVADLAEEADNVTVLYGGSVVHTGTTSSFLSHTPPDTAPGRAAEGAYDVLLTTRESADHPMGALRD